MSLSICLSVCPSVRLSLAVTSRTVVGSLWTVAAGGIQLGSANHRTADWDANLETETRRHADGQTDGQTDRETGNTDVSRLTGRQRRFRFVFRRQFDSSVSRAGNSRCCHFRCCIPTRSWTTFPLSHPRPAV